MPQQTCSLQAWQLTCEHESQCVPGSEQLHALQAHSQAATSLGKGAKLDVHHLSHFAQCKPHDMRQQHRHVAAGLIMAFTVVPVIFLLIGIGMWAALAEEMPRKAKPVNLILLS